MLGLDRQKIELSPYHPGWKDLFERGKNLLAAALGDKALAIEHIGSTAVEGLVAKPIIDLMVAVADPAAAEKCVAPLEKIGYEYRGEQGIPGRFYFRKGPSRTVSTHHLNVVLPDSGFWKDHLLFRDFLRRDPGTARRYGELKKKLAAEFEGDRKGYTEAKTDFIRSVLERAGGNLRG